MRTLSYYGSRHMMLRYATVACAAILIGLVCSFGALLRSGTLHLTQSDFMSYYGSFRLILDGHGGQIFDFHALGRVEAHLIYPAKLKGDVLPYIYPPYFALAPAPLALLPYAAAYALWSLANLALLVFAVAALQRYARVRPAERLLWWAATLSFFPVFITLAQGQVSILLLALMTLGFLALRSGRDALAGAALAFALIKPTYVVPVLAVLLLRRRWRALVAFGSIALCLAAAPAPILGLSINQAYLHTLLAASQWQTGHGDSVFAFFAPRMNHSLTGLAQLLLPRSAAALAAYVLDVPALVLLARSALRSQEVDLPLGLAVVVGVLVSPHVFIHDLSLLLLPVAVAIRYRALGPSHLPVMLAGLYTSIVAGLALVSVAPVQLSVIAMSAFCLWLAAVRDEQRSPRPLRTAAAMHVGRGTAWAGRDATEAS